MQNASLITIDGKKGNLITYAGCSAMKTANIMS
jgi:hypothetical protein